MDTTSPLVGDGLGGPVPFWTPDIKTMTAAYMAPLWPSRPRFRRPRRTRQTAVGVAVLAALLVPTTALSMEMSAVAAGASSHVIATVGPRDTWT